MRFAARPAVGLALLIPLVLSSGCGDSQAIKAVPAAGTVTFNGKPVEFGTIGFVPDNGRPASGEIKNGHFTLTTYQEDDGAIPGKHNVSVTSIKRTPAPGGGDPVTTFLVPMRFANAAESGVVVEVPPEGNIKLEVKLEEILNRGN
jgi:hypothetical protein